MRPDRGVSSVDLLPCVPGWSDLGRASSVRTPGVDRDPFQSGVEGWVQGRGARSSRPLVVRRSGTVGLSNPLPSLPVATSPLGEPPPPPRCPGRESRGGYGRPTVYLNKDWPGWPRSDAVVGAGRRGYRVSSRTQKDCRGLEGSKGGRLPPPRREEWRTEDLRSDRPQRSAQDDDVTPTTGPLVWESGRAGS